MNNGAWAEVWDRSRQRRPGPNPVAQDPVAPSSYLAFTLPLRYQPNTYRDCPPSKHPTRR